MGGAGANEGVCLQSTAGLRLQQSRMKPTGSRWYKGKDGKGGITSQWPEHSQLSAGDCQEPSRDLKRRRCKQVVLHRNLSTTTEESSETGSGRSLAYQVSVTRLKRKWNTNERRGELITLPVTPMAALPDNWWDLLSPTHSSPGPGQLPSKMPWAATSQFWTNTWISCVTSFTLLPMPYRDPNSSLIPSSPHQSQCQRGFHQHSFSSESASSHLPTRQFSPNELLINCQQLLQSRNLFCIQNSDQTE